MTTARGCGGCTACCFAMEISAMDKPARSKCPCEGYRKCNDYEGRPDECKTFECGWLAGVGSSKDRPDKSGVVLVNGPRFLQVHEIVKGAAGHEFARGVIDRALRHGIEVCLVATDGTRSILGNPLLKKRPLTPPR